MKKCNITFKSIADGVCVDTQIKGDYNTKNNMSLISFQLEDENEIQKFAFSILKDGSVRLTKSGNSNYSLLFKKGSSQVSFIKSNNYTISLSTKTTYLQTKIEESKILIDCKYILTLGGGDSFNSFYILAEEI